MQQLSPSPIRRFKPPPPSSDAVPIQVPEVSFSLEIGAGCGHHALRYSSENPNHLLVALERTQTRFKKALKQIEASPARGNLIFIRADAEWWLPQVARKNCLDQVFILYPNPYPKKSQAHLRFHRSPFMGYLLQHLSPRASLVLATNELDYFREASWYFTDYWKLQIQEKLLLPQSHHGARTLFEKKFFERGLSCYELTCQIPPGWKAPAPHLF